MSRVFHLTSFDSIAVSAFYFSYSHLWLFSSHLRGVTCIAHCGSASMRIPFGSMDFMPKLKIYRTSPEVAYERLRKRGRAEEAGVPMDFIKVRHLVSLTHLSPLIYIIYIYIDRPFRGGVKSSLIRSLFINWRLGNFFSSHFKWISS